MHAQVPDIFVVEGPEKGKTYAVSEQGLRLGRSSSCEICIKDPALSRNHCLFEVRDEALWVTDLASANGTMVNDEALGADSRKLAPGDRVRVGDSVLSIGSPTAAPASAAVDLGFGRPEDEAGQEGKAPLARLALWGVAVVAVAGAAALILMPQDDAASAPPPAELAEEEQTLRSVAFEKVEASADGIYRYALAMDKDGLMSVEIDDVPKENRHVRKSERLSPAAVGRLSKILSSPELYRLEPEYAGVALQPNTLKSFRLKVIRGSKVFTTSIENAQEPDAFREVRERLETFSKNELGIWAIQFPAEKLVEMSRESRRSGDAKWEERDVQYGNLAAALAAYNEAVFYLETVEPKPADFGALVERRQAAERELDRRYRDQRFRADRAINLRDWPTALRELHVLCELVPDAKDPRHAEAAAKLLDVEARQKKGASK
ncbi:MAG: FHA domain-containing protein [Kiritimatiellia bacterium]